MPESRNLVLCLDGTANSFSENNTNVVHLFRSIERYTPSQKAYYDPGVGTFNAGFFGWRVFKPVGKLLGSAFGYGVSKNITDAYRYLMNEYEEGDQVFIFGFSRGAYTARALAGMLHHVGLLHRGSDNLVPYAMRKYLNREAHPGVAEEFKTAFARECRPYFVGVWDTVGSLGTILRNQRDFDMDLNPDISFAYHALSVDERRSKFPPSLWNEGRATGQQKVQQVWFPGVHSDVGGGYPDQGLAGLAFDWMTEKARENGLLVQDEGQGLKKGDPTGEMHKSYKGKWKLLGTHIRKIPDGAYVHESVDQRRRLMNDYEPGNLPENINWVSA